MHFFSQIEGGIDYHWLGLIVEALPAWQVASGQMTRTKKLKRADAPPGGAPNRARKGEVEGVVLIEEGFRECKVQVILMRAASWSRRRKIAGNKPDSSSSVSSI
jgi:hypothetical protein